MRYSIRREAEEDRLFRNGTIVDVPSHVELEFWEEIEKLRAVAAKAHAILSFVVQDEEGGDVDDEQDLLAEIEELLPDVEKQHPKPKKEIAMFEIKSEKPKPKPVQLSLEIDSVPGRVIVRGVYGGVERKICRFDANGIHLFKDCYLRTIPLMPFPMDKDGQIVVKKEIE